MHEPAAVVLVAFGIGAFLRDAAQRTVGVEHPAMIEALEDRGLAGSLAADTAAAMRADVVEHADLARGIAVEDEVAAGHHAGEERTRLRQFGVVPAIEPATLENLLVLHVQDRLVGKHAPRHVEGALRGIVPDFERRSDMLVHVSALRWADAGARECETEDATEKMR